MLHLTCEIQIFWGLCIKTGHRTRTGHRSCLLLLFPYLDHQVVHKLLYLQSKEHRLESAYCWNREAGGIVGASMHPLGEQSCLAGQSLQYHMSVLDLEW